MPIFFLAFDALGDVAADHVSDFVGHDAGQFILGIQCSEQSAVEEDVPGRGGEGVVNIFPKDIEVVFERLGGAPPSESVFPTD